MENRNKVLMKVMIAVGLLIAAGVAAHCSLAMIHEQWTMVPLFTIEQCVLLLLTLAMVRAVVTGDPDVSDVVDACWPGGRE